MTESTLPVSPEPILAQDTQSPQSDIQTAAQEHLDKCRLQSDAVRGAMADMKRTMVRLNETQEALFRCRHGVELRGSLFPWEAGYKQGIAIQNAISFMEQGLATLVEHTGESLDGN